MKKQFVSELAAIAVAAMVSLTTFAAGESLEETGGYVPVNAPGLAFKNITLADLGTTWYPSVTKGGGWAGGEAAVPLILRTEEISGGALSAVTYQAQWNDGGYLKCATIRFTNGEGGVYAQTVDAKYTGSGVAAAYLTDFAGGTQGYCADSASANGYGFCNLKLHQRGEVDSVSINFNHSEETKLWTSDAVGLTGYAVGGMFWSQMLGTNNNTLPSVTAVGNDNGAFYAAVSSQVRITGTRGTYYIWQNTYTAASDVRYGYIDDDNNNLSPTVTISNIPFDRYKVIVYRSTDTYDAQFSYLTINGVNYTTTNTSKAESGDFATVEGTASWGKSLVGGTPIAGVNCLVSPATSARTLTVVGHRVGGEERGCIAAIQIVKTTEAPANEYLLEVTGDVTWSDLTDFTGDSAKRIFVNNDYGAATITFDTAVQAASLVLTGSGSTTLKFNDTSYNQIAEFYFKSLTGEVAIDDVIREAATFTPPETGTLRYKGTATLTEAPNNSGNLSYGVIVDQPMNMSEFQLAGVKTLYGFGPNCNATFSSRFVLGNNNGSNQTVTQYGGSIEVSGDNENYNNSSVLLGHWGSLTVNFNTYGGTFTATNASARLGHTGKCYWTIGDGENADDSTAVADLKGVVNANGSNDNGGSGSRLVLQQGGTLKIGEGGINLPNSSVEFAGGKLATSHSSAVTVSASSVTAVAGTDTELNTVNGLAISSAITGSGSLTKTGAGTLTLSAASSATGTLAVDSGTLSLASGATWAGTVSLGANGTLDIVDANINEQSTVYIHVGGTLNVGSGTVKVNGTAINTEVWELSGGTYVNKNLMTAVTTATGDFAFSTATWENALGSASDVNWANSLSEVRIHANNASPATATVDVDAAAVASFAVDGAGDLTITAGNGAISANAYDFSGSTGRVEYGLPTGSSPVTSGSNTIISGGGSGTPTVAAGKTLTLGPWGTEDGTTYTYSTILMPAAGSTLLFAPGAGRTQKCAGFGGTNTGTTIGVTNGTLVVNMAGGGDSVFFGVNSVRIDDGGILSLESQDALGYNNARRLTINKGGVLSVKVRDTLKRTVTMNGGAIEVQGANSGRALDFFNGNVINVTDDSTIQAVATSDVANPTIWFRAGTTVINIDDGVTLMNNVTYESTTDGQSKGSVTVLGTMNKGVGNGCMEMNGFNGNPLTFVGLATIGETTKPVTYALNCEHQNGTYVVNAGSRLMGSGSITGAGGVTFAASNSKICGSLTVNNLKAASGGTFGDQWNAVSAKVATSYFAAGTQTIENGSFTIGKDCVVTNAAGAADTTAATFSVKANGNLTLEKAVTVGGLTVADGGTITLKQATVGNTTALAVNGTMTQSGTLNIVLRYDSGIPLSVDRIPLIAASGLNVANITLDAGDARRRMKLVYENGVLYCVPKGGFFLKLY